jgi:hypothetical protein
MAKHAKNATRRFARATGPFDGQHLGARTTSVRIYNLNLGGGLVTFADEPPAADTFILRIDLPQEGLITATAEALYRDPAGVAVRFVGLDEDESGRLSRAIERAREEQHSKPRPTD